MADWPDRATRQRRTAIRRVTEAGFTAAEATRWTRASPHITLRPDLLAACAARWRDAGFDVVTAVAWFAAEVPLAQAKAWTAAGYAPHQARRVITAIAHDHPDADRGSVGESWRSSGIPAEWAARYAAAGCTLDEARALEDERGEGIEHAATLETLAALRGLGAV